VPAETSPAVANDPVSRCTYSSRDSPIIAIGILASSDVSTATPAPGVVSAAR
jgi:hypothetical protein